MPLQGMILNGPYSYNATAALDANTVVTVDTSGGVTMAISQGIPTGTVQEAFAINKLATVYPARGRHLVTASAAIAAGDFVKCAANGQVAPEASVAVATAFTIGVAETAAAGQGSTFWMIFF